MDTMYEILMRLPLFQGVSYSRVTEFLTRTKVHFLKYPTGETVIQKGVTCDSIKFIISGAVRLTTINGDGRFNVSQTLKAPDVIGAQYLFGRYREYPYTVVAIKDTGMMQIAKRDYVGLLRSDEVFLYNYLNILGSFAQKPVEGVLSITDGSLSERIAFWVLTLTKPSSHEITLECKLRDLYALFGVQRSLFVATLDEMAENGVLTYDSNSIKISERQKLVDLLNHKQDL